MELLLKEWARGTMRRNGSSPATPLPALVLICALAAVPAQAQRKLLVAEVSAPDEVTCPVKDGVTLRLKELQEEDGTAWPRRVTLLCRGGETFAMSSLALVEGKSEDARAEYRDGLGGVWHAQLSKDEADAMAKRTLLLKPGFFAYRFGEGRLFSSIIEAPLDASAPALPAGPLKAGQTGLESAKRRTGKVTDFGHAADGSRGAVGVVGGPQAVAVPDTPEAPHRPTLSPAVSEPASRRTPPAPPLASASHAPRPESPAEPRWTREAPRWVGGAIGGGIGAVFAYGAILAGTAPAWIPGALAAALVVAGTVVVVYVGGKIGYLTVQGAQWLWDKARDGLRPGSSA